MYVFQGGVGIDRETLLLMFERLSAGKAYYDKVMQMDEADKSSEETRQVSLLA